MRASEVTLPSRPREFAGERVSLLAAVLASVSAGALVATSPKWTLAALAGTVFTCAVFVIKRERLPGLALATYALFAAPYLGLPKTFGRFLGPATLILLVWAVRTIIASERRRHRMGRAWVTAATAMCTWLALETVLSLRPSTSFLWSAVFGITIPLAGTAAILANDATRDILIRAWTALSVALGAFATFEGVTHWNPLAAHYTVDGQPLVQKWAVYRVETTLGHPLVNAMFFATSAAVMTMLAIEKPTRWRVTAAILSASGLVFTASRTGVIGLSLGIGVALVAMTFSRRTTTGRKIIAISVIVAALIVVFQSPILKARDRSAEAQASMTYRSNVIRDSLLVIRADGYLGSGPGTSQRRIDQSGTSLVLENSILQLGVSTGLPGVAVLFVLLGAVAGTAVRRARWEAFAGLIACVVAATGFNAWDAIPETLALLGLVIILGLTPETQPTDGAEGHAA